MTKEQSQNLDKILSLLIDNKGKELIWATFGIAILSLFLSIAKFIIDLAKT